MKNISWHQTFYIIGHHLGTASFIHLLIHQFIIQCFCIYANSSFSLKVHQLLLNKKKVCKRVQKCLSVVLCTYNYQIVSTRTKTDVIFYRYECIISAFHLKVAILSKGNHISALKLLIFMQAYFFPLIVNTHSQKAENCPHLFISFTFSSLEAARGEMKKSIKFLKHNCVRLWSTEIHSIVT